jgi:hypothetical protein
MAAAFTVSGVARVSLSSADVIVRLNGSARSSRTISARSASAASALCTSLERMPMKATAALDARTFNSYDGSDDPPRSLDRARGRLMTASERNQRG